MKNILLALLALNIVWGTAPASAQTDQIPASSVTWVAGPNIAEFAATTTITRVDLRVNGVEVQFSKRQGVNRWPDNRTPGWQGDLQYSLGIVERINGQWVGSAPIETWYGNNVIGGQIQDTVTAPPGQIATNWFYDNRWGVLAHRQPAVGEQIGLFVVAGDARNSFNPVKERSNIVIVTMPANGVAAAFDFGASPTPEPTPTPTPDPTPVPVPTVSCASQASVDALKQELDQIELILKGAQSSLAPGGSFWSTLLKVLSLGTVSK